MSQNPILIPSDSILNGDQSSLKPKEIFQSVCDLIGTYYQKQGWKYTKSRPRIRWTNDEYALEIDFWSSKSNTAGEWVNLEILGSAHSNNLALLDKEVRSKLNGCFTTTQDFMRKINASNPEGKVEYYNADGIIVGQRQTDLPFAMDVFTNNFNIYDINSSGLNHIVNYIDKMYSEPMHELFTQEGALNFFRTVIPQNLEHRDLERILKFVEFHHQNDEQLIKMIKQKFMWN